MNRFLITVAASRDLEEISTYFLEKNVEAGERFVEGFNKKCQQLARFPIWDVLTLSLVIIYVGVR